MRVVTIAVLLLVFVGSCRSDDAKACEAKDGVLVRGVSKFGMDTGRYVCVKREALVK